MQCNKEKFHEESRTESRDKSVPEILHKKRAKLQLNKLSRIMHNVHAGGGSNALNRFASVFSPSLSAIA